MPLLCLPGDGPKLGLGPAMSLPRAKAPNGRSLGPNQLGEVPPRFWEAGALWAWKDWIIPHCTDRCNTCMGKSSEDSTVGMSAVVTSGRCVLDFNFLIYVYCYFVVVV